MVGSEIGGKPRALASDPCMDQASGENVRLLESDREMFDIRGRATVRLCDHHRQLYTAACSGRKCSVLACFEPVAGSKQGVPLCRQHLLEIGSAAKPARKVSWRDDTPKRGETLELSTPRTPKPRGASKARASSASLQSAQQRRIEGSLAQGPCAVLLSFQSQQVADQSPAWLCLFGELEGYSEEGRAQEKVRFLIPDQQVQGVVLTAKLWDSPLMNEAGRLSKSWAQNFLCSDHAEAAASRISVLVSRISPEQKRPLAEWHGKITNGSSSLPNTRTSALRERLLREVLPHADAHLIRSNSSVEADDFMTPPRPIIPSFQFFQRSSNQPPLRKLNRLCPNMIFKTWTRKLSTQWLQPLSLDPPTLQLCDIPKSKAPLD